MIRVRELQNQVALFKKREQFEEIISKDLLEEAKQGKTGTTVSYKLDETPFNGVEEALEFLTGRGFTQVEVDMVEEPNCKFINISLSWDNAFNLI